MKVPLFNYPLYDVHFTKRDEIFMHCALELARRGVGSVGPHALVGSVVVRDDEIVGEGYYRYYGDRHAEVQALEKAGVKARGAELFVNLEPCCHIGRNPPCTDTIIRSGVRRVVFSIADPNPKVAGNGCKTLKVSGIDIESGLLAGEATQLNRAFLKFVSTKKPWLFRMVDRIIPQDGFIAGQIISSDIQSLVPVINIATLDPPSPKPTNKGWPSIGWADLDSVKHSTVGSAVLIAVEKATTARIPFLVLRSSQWIHTREIIDEDQTVKCKLHISKLVPLHTSHGVFQVAGFECAEHGLSGMLIGNHPDKMEGTVAVRIQSECIPAHVLRDTHSCDCARQFKEGLKIVKSGGILIYLSGHEGRGLGIADKLNEYALREWHYAVIHRDIRNFWCAASILLAFHIKTVKLLTKNKEKSAALLQSGIKLV